jgi:putative peptidoglycan lipid II flippase
VAWNSALVTGLNALALIVGLVIYPVIAGRYAPVETDAFFLALTLPWLFIGPAMNAISSTLIPVLTECRERRPEAVGPLLGSALGYGTACALAATLLLAGAVWGAATLNLDLLPPGSMDRVVANVLWLSPLIVLQTVTSVLDTAGNAAGRFWLPASAMLLRQAVTLVALIALGRMLGVSSLPLAFTVGALFHLGLLAGMWRDTTPPIRLSWRLHPDLRNSVRLAVPLLVGTLVLQIGVLVTRWLAAHLPPGSVTALDFAARMTNAILELTTSGVLIVILADWSSVMARRKPGELREKLRRTVRLVLFVLLPVLVVLYALREPVVGLWLAMKDSTHLVTLTAATLGFFLLGLPLDIVSRIYVRVFLVYQETRVLAFLAVARSVTMVVLAVFLVKRLGVPGLALADTVGLFVTLVGLLLAVRGHLGNSLSGLTGSLARLAVIAAAGWWTAASVAELLPGLSPAALIPLAGGAAVSVYLVLAWCFNSEELKLVRGLVAGVPLTRWR